MFLILVLLAAAIFFSGLLDDPLKKASHARVQHTNADPADPTFYYQDDVNARAAANQKFQAEFDKIASDGNELNQKMARVFSASNLATESGIEDAQAFIPEYRKYITEKNNTLLAFQEEITKELVSYNIKSEPFWNDYKQRNARAVKLIGKLFSADNEILDNMAAMVGFIKIHLARCKVVNNNLVFDEPSLNQQYQDYIQTINGFDSKENQTLDRIKNQSKYETTGMEIHIQNGLEK